jgi:NAD(P)-dependent dehydrogenase (short-subunit alcohol dehydrogenase family)
MSSLRAVADGSVSQSGTSHQYRTTKTALRMAKLVLAKELQPRGISVVRLCLSVTGMKKILNVSGMEISGKFLG